MRSLSRRSFLSRTALTAAGGVALTTGGAGLMTGFARPAFAAAAGTVGAPAPAFTGTDMAGKSVSLADFQGKVVVLEWTNTGCPFVRKHYDGGNMQALQAEFAGKGVVWLSVISSAEGQQGYMNAADAQAHYAKEKWAGTHMLLDPQGTIGRAFDAKVTPHMYVIGADGTLLYNGAIDSIRSTRVDDVPKAEPWFRNAVAAVLEGRPVENATNAAYGCTIKYAKASA
ncbi:MAG: hypothetical protein RLY86_4061 [Pseudomonadota bacterium]|jgi:glutathione peroxidase-family protein